MRRRRRHSGAPTRARLLYANAAGTVALIAVVGALTPTVGTTAASTSTGAASTTPAVNLLTPNQTTFAGGSTGDWVGSNATLSSTGSALQVAATTTSDVSAWSALMPAGQPTAATPGDKYTGEANVEVTTPSPTIGDALVFFNSAGTILTSVWGQAVTPTASTWTTLPEVGAIAPSGTAFVGLGVMSWTALLGQDFLVENPVLSVLTTPPVAPAVAGPLHTSGNQVVQANGQAVTLRGVVMPGLEQTGTLSGTGVSQQAIQEAHAWGANFVRVPLGEQFWLSSNCDYVAGYTATVDQVVNWITSLGMVALLDLHTNTVGGCETGSQHNMADEAQSPTFWSQVAQRYGNATSPEYNPLVAFDLYNEPHNITDAVWLNGGQTTDPGLLGQSYPAAGMQQLYNAVRAAGASNLVFISGNNWANTPPSTLVQGNNIVYAVHYYTCPSAAPPNCSNANPDDPTPVLSQWVGLSATQPVAVTEFGWPSQADGTYDSNVLAYATEQGWGWSAYAWEDVQHPDEWDLNVAYTSDGTAEPSPSGMPVFFTLANETLSALTCTSPGICGVGGNPGPVGTSTAVSVTPSSVTQGATVTYSATVTASNGAAPTGTVSFSTGGVALCTTPELVDGTQSCTATNAPVGDDSIEGDFVADSNSGYGPSSGSAVLSVSPAPQPSPPPPSAPQHGYWLVGSDGGIFNFGSAGFFGSTGSLKLQRPVVGISPTADRAGYWLVASDGGVFAYGDAGFVGSIPGLGLHPAGSGFPHSLNAPIVGIVPSTDGGGYFMVASDGGVFAFGDAQFAGSCPGIGGCSGSAVAVLPDATGNGYWVVTTTGNVYAFGDAANYGAPGHGTVTSAVATPDGRGYWILLGDGHVFAYGDAANLGSSSADFNALNPATAILATSDGGGYWVASAEGAIYTFGDAPNDGSMTGTKLNGAVIAGSGY